MKILVAGWFSFEQMGATAGDLIARDLVVDWLDRAGLSCDIALAPPFRGGVRWKEVDASSYSDVIFVCGPFGNGWPVTEFLDLFSKARLIGINLTMLQDLEEWNPFDLLVERDSSRTSNPDITLCAAPSKVPVAGIILAHKQKEYGERALHDGANRAIQKLMDRFEVAVVPIDTALDENDYGLRTPGEIESLIARMDLVITTRLHGTVLALKNEVPAIPIDPIEGGAKITRQVETLAWPLLFQAGRLNENELNKAFEYCLSENAKKQARSCHHRAVRIIEQNRQRFIEGILKLRKS